MNKIFLMVMLLVGMSFGATYYIDYVGGSDANNGTAKATPWKRAPGMIGTTGNVLSYEQSHNDAQGTAPAGDVFIFKGGVTWPNGCFAWAWIWGGGTGWVVGTSAVYFGVDQTWYTGGAWARPIFDAEGLAVTSNTKSSPPVENLIFRPYKNIGGYFIIDNLEFKGMYVLRNLTMGMLVVGATIAEIKNCYFHGWGHGPVENIGPCNDLWDAPISHSYCNKWTSGPDSGDYVSDNLQIISTKQDEGDVDIRIHHCYIDGSDASPTPGDMGAAVLGFGKHFYNNYVNGVQNILTARFWDYVWGNTFTNLYTTVDFEASAHHNLYQLYGGVGRNSYVYNNLSKDIDGGATFLWYAEDSSKVYCFNNVDCADNNMVFQLSNSEFTSNSNNSGYVIWNNSIESTTPNSNWSTMGIPQSGYTPSEFLLKNNLLIAPSKTTSYGVFASVLDSAKNNPFTNAEATSAGYVSSTTYPLFPSSGSSVTVGTGVSMASMSSVLVDSDSSKPSIACLYDAALGVAINTSNHTVSYPKRTPILRGSTWDIGAYEYASGTQEKIVRINIVR